MRAGRIVFSIICWVAAGEGFAAAQSPKVESQEYTISANVELVLLDVSVRDRDGGFVSGLTKDSFRIFENGKAQEITQFQSEDQPVTVGLIIDNSGSMTPKRAEVITAALVFIGASNPLDEIFVINFNDTVRRGLPDPVPFSDDIGELRKALWKDPPSGRTALYDAVAAGLKHLEMGRQAKKTLIIVSDGGDNASQAGLNDVMRKVLESQATIYTIGIYNEDDPDKNPAVLSKMANVSGGVAYFPRELKNIQDVARQIAKDIRSRYTLAYVPKDLSHAGVKRIKVQAFSEARGGKLNARTRTHYIAPSSSENTATAERRKED